MLRNFLLAVVVLFVLTLLLVFCEICDSANAQDTDKSPLTKPITLFLPATTKFKEDAPPATRQFESFTFPSLNYVKNVLVVVAQAKDKSNGKKCDIVEGHFKFVDAGDLTDKFSKDADDTKWTMQVVTKDNTQEHCKGNPTTVVNNTKFYVFFNSGDKSDSLLEYGFLYDEIAESSGNGEIKWSAQLENLKGKFNTEGLTDKFFVASGSSGIVVNNSIVVPLWYKTKDDFISAIINSSNTDDKDWTLVSNDFTKEEKYPAVVEWDNKIIMMTSCKKGFRKVYEYDEIKKEWTEAVGSLSGVWGNTERTPGEYGGKNGFITADIGKEGNKKEVILLLQPVAQPITKSAKIKAENDYKLHLWMTDYKRVYDVGEISAAEVGKDISSTLLYAKENLFAAWEKEDSQKSGIYAAHLKDQLEKIKNVLEKWKMQDNDLSKSCFGTDGTITSGGKCTANISTTGLVGFLSDKYENNNWVDKYMCVNATVAEKVSSTVTKETNGLKFSGAGAGASWPVGAQGQNKRYHFANHAFTLVATVRIDIDANGNKNSVLGIGLEGSNGKKHIGLWCSNGKWEIGEKNTAEKTVTAKECVKEGIYQVALILKENNFSVYIGKKTEGPTPDKSIVEKPLSITHFYFGANIGMQESPAATESHVTVTNVLLYNRPFNPDEIKKLKEYVKSVEVIKNFKENTKAQQPENSEPTSDQQPPTLQPSTEEKDEKGPSPSRTGDGGVGGGVRVFSLLLPLLCVSAPLLHL